MSGSERCDEILRIINEALGDGDARGDDQVDQGAIFGSHGRLAPLARVAATSRHR
ncbi:MAG TPA: hypothetical protein VE990_13945 [Acidimicrobiales bacterium]|nr:hypothetical protein [Acidimicrobiales bacterium]